MFFTKLNLAITKGMYKCYESHIPTHNTIIRRENLRTQKDLERINKWTNENIYKEYLMKTFMKRKSNLRELCHQ